MLSLSSASTFFCVADVSEALWVWDVVEPTRMRWGGQEGDIHAAAVPHCLLWLPCRYRHTNSPRLPISYAEIPEYEEGYSCYNCFLSLWVAGWVCSKQNKLSGSVRCGIFPSRPILVMSRKYCSDVMAPSLHVLIWFLSQLWPFNVSVSLWLSCSSQDTQHGCGESDAHPLTFRDLRRKTLIGKFGVGCWIAKEEF